MNLKLRNTKVAPVSLTLTLAPTMFGFHTNAMRNAPHDPRFTHVRQYTSSPQDLAELRGPEGSGAKADGGPFSNDAAGKRLPLIDTRRLALEGRYVHLASLIAHTKFHFQPFPGDNLGFGKFEMVQSHFSFLFHTRKTPGTHTPY